MHARTQHSRRRPNLPLAVTIALAAALALAGAASGQQSGSVRDFPAIDGVGNNPENPLAGSAGMPLLRAGQYAYRDGAGAPGGWTRPSARLISNALASETREVLNARGVSDYFWLWGQFLDHDIDLTEAADPDEPFDITVPAGDPFFDPGFTGNQFILLNRSAYDPRTGTGARNPRRQLNAITAYIDASNVYGSDAARAAALRRNDGSGELRTSRGDLLPFNRGGLANAGGTSSALYLAGDIRANENVALTAMHTLWVREHNRLARQIRRDERGLSGEEIYQRARMQVIATIQAITFEEFVPLLLGRDALGPARRDRNADAGIMQEFSTAAYRFGHSMVSPRLLRLGADGRPIARGNLPLDRAFFAPQQLTPAIGLEPYLRGLARQQAREIDVMVVDELRNFLFGPPGAGGFDLAALNIQRGRDHGLDDYNAARAAYGLPRRRDFGDITAFRPVADALREIYGDIDDVDLWIAGLAEDHLAGAMVGETFHAILSDQFRRLRDGDRFYYRNVFRQQQLRRIERTTLADVIRRNTDIDRELPDDVFRARR